MVRKRMLVSHQKMAYLIIKKERKCTKNNVTLKYKENNRIHQRINRMHVLELARTNHIIILMAVCVYLMTAYGQCDKFSLSPIRKKYPDVTIQPDSRCIVGSGGGNTVSGLAAARAGNVHSPQPARPVIIQLACVVTADSASTSTTFSRFDFSAYIVPKFPIHI